LLNELANALQVSKSANQQIGKSQIANRKSQTATDATRNTQYDPAVELLSAAKSPLFIYGPDAATGERGKATVAALGNLAALLGQGDKLAYIGPEANSQGCRDMGLLPDTLPGQLALTDAGVRDRLGKLWGVQPPVEPGQSYAQMVAGGVKGLLVVGLDPVAQEANTAALRDLKFLAVQDLFLTETAKLADVVLPACSFAEADGTYTNLERRVQRGPQGIRAAGESRADWAIIDAVAERWLAAQGVEAVENTEAAKLPDWKRKKRKAKQGPAAKPWHYPNAQAVLEEIGKAVLFYAPMRWEALGEGGIQWPASALPRSARKPETIEVAALAPLAAGSFHLVSSPVLWDSGLFMQHSAAQVRDLIPAPFVALNPADLAARKLAEGSEVQVSSAHGSVTLVLKSDASVQPGTAWVPFGLAGLPAEALGAGRGEAVALQVTG
jgi:predicted molibdopterin-dependent oxidoreductase YjgC